MSGLSQLGEKNKGWETRGPSPSRFFFSFSKCLLERSIKGRVSPDSVVRDEMFPSHCISAGRRKIILFPHSLSPLLPLAGGLDRFSSRLSSISLLSCRYQAGSSQVQTRGSCPGNRDCGTVMPPLARRMHSRDCCYQKHPTGR